MHGIALCVKKRYFSKVHYDAHIRNCEPVPSVGCAIQRSLAIAHSMIFEEQSIQIYTRNEMNPALSKVSFDPATDCRTVKRGYERRPKWGDAMGKNAMEKCKPQIREWFTIGAVEPAKKMSANRMHKLIQNMDPDRYDILSKRS